MKLISKNLSSSGPAYLSPTKSHWAHSAGKPFHYKIVPLISAKSQMRSFDVFWLLKPRRLNFQSFPPNQCDGGGFSSWVTSIRSSRSDHSNPAAARLLRPRTRHGQRFSGLTNMQGALMVWAGERKTDILTSDRPESLIPGSVCASDIDQAGC